ncbi:hypothetical protein [Stakelama marina]|uniref:Uncharacterized protein n=1 Tax=Stakelama marina TaxID=2826939 RepID=A0A8T4IH06_9SPHN|nr:hypothetical protein [Stakelama marina]MBR0553913.1 hypothetical protein [Stakelama marina]
MAMTALARMAARAPVPVFVATGQGWLASCRNLAASVDVAVVTNIREAAILIVAGEPRDEDRDALRRLHDQMPHPRATAWWGARPFAEAGSAIEVSATDDPGPLLRSAFAALLARVRESEPDWLPDDPPNPWQGEGDHGQGGKGMMGGTPYGRPMAMTADDLRDGLALDSFTFTIGPFYPSLPPGLALELTLQGDVIQSARVVRPPLDPGEDAAGACRSMTVGRMLRLLELDALARRCEAVPVEDRDAVNGLKRWIGASCAMRAIPKGLGRLAGDDARARFTRMVAALGDAEASSIAGPGGRLVDLLPGLEWNEALLVINSFSHRDLVALAPREMEQEEDSEGSAEQREGHGI